jgi:hypothetical protein
MNIKTTVKKTSDTHNQITKTITAPNSPFEGQDGVKAKLYLLQEVVNNPTLADCGGSSFHVLTLSYSGLAWEIKVTANNVPNGR